MAQVYCALLLFASIVATYADTTPQQLHLSLTQKKDEMVVMWMSDGQTSTSSVIFWEDGSSTNYTATGSADRYVFPPDYESPYIHTVKLTGLKTDTKYNYVCGDATGGWSDIAYFNTRSSSPPSPQKPLVFASIGDHGTSPDSHNVLNALLRAEDEEDIPFELLVHAGDISYANGVQKYWDLWGNIVAPFANHIPWMTSVGNHEALDAFVAYLWRFTMPNTDNELYHSFNYGPAHFIAVSSEMGEYWHFLHQYTWLQNDLASVNRTETPWIIAFWHTPWYCSNKHHYEDGKAMRESYEDLFNKHNVDLVLNGHVHAYERTVPMYKGVPTPGGTTYITNGIGGTEEGLATDWYPAPKWSAFRESTNWGFGVAYIHNATHLYWEMRAASDGTVKDNVWLVRQR